MKKVYLDNACTSIVQPEVLAVAEEYAELYRNSEKSASDITRECRSYMEKARKAAARLIHCKAAEVALIESTSHGLGIIADAVILNKEDNILIADLEYQASTICWKRKQEDCGFEIRQVKTTGGILSKDDFARYTDKNTKLIMIASVQEINGYRADIGSIVDFAHHRDILVAVDGIQEAGALQVDVKATGVDFYCAGGKKWIGNPFGMGFLYIREELIPWLKPNFYSYFNIQVPAQFADYITYLEDPIRNPFDEYTIIDDATKFEIGGYGNYIGALGLTKAIEVLLERGPKQIEEKIRRLNRRYTQGLSHMGIETCSSKEEEHMSSIVAFNFGFRDGDISRERRLIPFLQKRNIYVSLRSSTGTGGIRASFHYYNSETDIDSLLEGIKAFLEEDR